MPFLKTLQHLKTASTLHGILLLSVIARVLAALYLGNDVVELPGIHDQISYHELALRVLGGYGFSFGEVWWPITAANAPTAHWSFLYTLYLTAVYALFGINPIVARLIQAVIVGICHPYITFKLGELAFNKRVGLIAAGLTAVYLYFIYYSAALMTETLYISGILASLYLIIRLAQVQGKEERKLILLLGVTIGGTILLRQLFLLLVPFLFAWLWWVRYQNGRSLPLQATLLPLLIAAAMILPFSLYNYQRFDRFVLLNTNAGYAFYLGNHPIYGTRFVPILTPEMGSYQDLIPSELYALDEAALEQELMARGVQFVFDDPIRYLQLSASRIPAYFNFWPSASSSLISNLSRLGSFGLLWPFMLYGLFGSLRQAKWHTILLQPYALLIMFAIAYTALHLLTWALIRYRLPVDGVMLLFAGTAVLTLFQRLFNPKEQLQATVSS